MPVRGRTSRIPRLVRPAVGHSAAQPLPLRALPFALPNLVLEGLNGDCERCLRWRVLSDHTGISLDFNKEDDFMPSRSVKKTSTARKRKGAAPRTGAGSARKSAGRMDAVSMLKQDHGKVKQLLNRLEATTERAGNQRRELFKQIETELKTHTRLEEEIFYPAFQEAVKKSDEHMFYEAVEEHHLVDILLSELKSCSVESEEF